MLLMFICWCRMIAKIMFSSCGKTFFPGDSVDDLPSDKLEIAIERNWVTEDTNKKEVINQSQKKKKKGKRK